jgi:hypothetical protein
VVLKVQLEKQLEGQQKEIGQRQEEVQQLQAKVTGKM